MRCDATIAKTLLQTLALAACFHCVNFNSMCLAAAAPEMRAQLERARQTLGISEASRRSIEMELERLRSSDPASVEAIEQYEDYSVRVSDMVDRQREILEQMEALAASMDPETASLSESRAAESDPILAPVLPEEEDEAMRLERSFHVSLAEFDAKLMKRLDELARELEELSDEASDHAGSLASAVEAAKQRLEQGSRDSEAANEDSGEGRDASSPGTQSGEREADRERADGDAEDESTKTADASEAGSEMDPGSIGQPGTRRQDGMAGRTDGSDPQDPVNSTSSKGQIDFDEDDDIVARQLREAAESETDPVLKEKLWKEYRKYKQSGS